MKLYITDDKLDSSLYNYLNISSVEDLNKIIFPNYGTREFTPIDVIIGQIPDKLGFEIMEELINKIEMSCPVEHIFKHAFVSDIYVDYYEDIMNGGVTGNKNVFGFFVRDMRNRFEVMLERSYWSVTNYEEDLIKINSCLKIIDSPFFFYKYSYLSDTIFVNREENGMPAFAFKCFSSPEKAIGSLDLEISCKIMNMKSNLKSLEFMVSKIEEAKNKLFNKQD